KLGMEDDLQQQVSEFLGQRRRRPGAEGVVYLVRLFEEMVAQRLMGLLAVPRAAIGPPQPIGDPGHRPGARERKLRGNRREVDRRRQNVRAEVADRRRLDSPESSDGMVGRVEPSKERDWVVASGPMAARERADRLARANARAN